METGGTSIISYNVQWDSGSSGSFWSNLAGFSSNYLAQTYTATSAIIAGTSYQIRIRAKNYWGYGPFSSVITIKASAAPNQVSVPMTSIDVLSGGIRVNWAAPYANSEVIDQYLVEAQQTNGAWV